MKKKLPVGISDFRTVIEDDYYYVDKSLLIKELLDNGSQTVLLLRPRRFGKTLNLSMLRYFFERTGDDTSRLFRHLEIWRQGETYTSYRGKHPVIFLTFKDVKSRDWETCSEHLRRVIGEEYRRHRYVLDYGTLDTDEQAEYRGIIERTVGEVAYETSLKKLSVYLERHHGRKTVILIDEYDTPIQGGYMHRYYDEVVHFMRSLLGGALKDNTSLEKGVLTGILRVAKESIFSGLNNLEVCTLLRSDFSTHFGLLDGEVERLLTDYEVGTPIREVKDWYNGYMFGGTTIYNPWSLINYAKSWQEGLQPFWVNTSGNDLIRELLTECGADVKEELESLLRGESILKEINDNIVLRDIQDSSSAVWSFLLFSGYLKIVSQERELRLRGEVRIPNREVAFVYEDIVRGWFASGRRSKQHRQLLEALTNGDMETFEEVFRDFVVHAFSMFDAGGVQPENVYHAFVLGLLVSLQDDYEVKSNRESGYGRYDVMLIPKGEAGHHANRRKGIVFEFKKTRRNETLEEAAAAALRQIEEKNYEAELQARGVRDILKIGLAFQGKQIAMRTQ